MYALAQLNSPLPSKKKTPPKHNASVIGVHDFILVDLHFWQHTAIS